MAQNNLNLNYVKPDVDLFNVEKNKALLVVPKLYLYEFLSTLIQITPTISWGRFESISFYKRLFKIE